MNLMEIGLSGLVGAILGSALTIWFTFELEHRRFEREAATRFLGWMEAIANELARVEVKCGRVAGYGSSTETAGGLRAEAGAALERFAERLSNFEPLAAVNIAFGRDSDIADAANQWVQGVSEVAELVRTNPDSPGIHKRVEEEIDPALLVKKKQLAELLLSATSKGWRRR